ncbi:MAG: RNA polymerase sigma factor [Candidatus Staskawiczbacteria bacterium]|nr:RNA polymerase sigma factor [Candidatus Staskawiczbacteria bacterium]
MVDIDKNDEEIASLVQSGKVDFFGILIERYEKKMERYARRILNNQDDVKDVIQEIFIKAYINIKSFDASRKFSPWLYRIAHNEIVNVYRKNKRKSFLPIFDVDTFLPHIIKEGELSIQKQVDRREMKEIIEKCLINLEEKYKEPIVLYYIEDLSYKEISDIMHLPISTVGVRIKRAKKIMKEIFKSQNYNG